MEYQELDALISELEGMIQDDSPQKGYWKQLWNLVGEIGTAFKGTRYPSGGDKDEAWKRFQSIVERAKTRSDENKERIREREREFEQRKNRSERARRAIEGQAAGARPLSGFERGIADIFLLPLTLAERLLEALLGIKAKSELEQIHDELRICSQHLKDAWRAFSDSKDAVLPGDKAQVYQTLTKAQERLNLAWDRWKAAKSEFRAVQQRAWEAKQRDWEERRREREIKQQQFVERVRANIRKLEDKLDNARSALSRNEVHLNKLRDDYASAWNDGFRDRCSGWIDECEDKIRSIREHIERLEGWIDEERRKLG